MVIGMTWFGSLRILKGHLGNDLFITTEAIPILLDIQLQIGKMMLMTDDQHQVIVF
jgi:hypothetical protein